MKASVGLHNQKSLSIKATIKPFLASITYSLDLKLDFSEKIYVVLSQGQGACGASLLNERIGLTANLLPAVVRHRVYQVLFV